MRFVSFSALWVRGSVMLKYLHFVRNSDTLLFLFAYLGERSCCGVDDKTADNDVIGLCAFIKLSFQLQDGAYGAG